MGMCETFTSMHELVTDCEDISIHMIQKHDLKHQAALTWHGDPIGVHKGMHALSVCKSSCMIQEGDSITNSTMRHGLSTVHGDLAIALSMT